MALKIEAISSIQDAHNNEYVALAYQAARQCLNPVKFVFSQVDLTINCSTYNAAFLGEPAIATLIQHEVNQGQKNIHHVAFDLNNGGGGVPNAIHVMDVMLQDNHWQNGLIIAGDSYTTKWHNKYVTTLNSASALLLSKSSTNDGFVTFQFDTYPEYLEEAQNFINWPNGRLAFNHIVGGKYLEHCLVCAKKSISKFIEQNDLNISEIDELICPMLPEGFDFNLRAGLGFERIESGYSTNPLINSDSLLCSLGRLFESTKWKDLRNVLIVHVGPGISVSVTLYKNVIS